ncbi:transport and Golgi organization protein 6 homolog [Daphnia carinata]|uniref:transport and Golgi organization protein 6 homolog n=1 Tax=Daphnia carinata TaxID=120202 RepID=UPI0025806378|nr:transport and Golgi organization protein 6 homolog [Daphnia carinata]
MDNCMTIRLKVIAVLCKPQLEKLQGSSVETIDQVLQNNLALVRTFQNTLADQGNHDLLKVFGIEKCHIGDVKWSYSCLCLETILEVAKAMDLDAANCNKSTIHSDSSVPCLSVQHEIDIAKCFQLIVGFGLLPNLLPNIGIPIQRRSKYYNLFHQSPHLTDEQKYSRLTVVVRGLCEIEKSQSFGPKFATKHLADLLTALLQICHAPISKPTSDSQVLLWQRLHEERQEFVPLLNSVIERTYPPLLVQNLLLLQGPSASHAKIIRDAPKPAPKWLIRVCAHLLTQQLMKPNGLAMTIQGVMDLAEITSEMWQRCDSLAYIISTPPSRDPEKQREYYSTIGPQLSELVTKSHKILPDAPFNRIASGCYREIAARYRHVAEDTVFGPLFQPLASEDQDVLIRSIETLHSIFVEGTDPSGLLMLLVPHSYRLMQLYRIWCQSILQVKTLLEELIVRLIRHSDNPDRVGLLRSLLQTQNSDDDEAFLDEDEKSVMALISILQRIEDVHLTYSVFVSLLEDLPQLMVDQPPSSSLAPQQPHLLHSVRRGLVTLRLIGLLSEDEQLQSFLLNNPQQAVDFAQVFLKRAAENLDRNHFDVDLEKEGLAIVFAVIALQIDNLVEKEDKSKTWSLFDPLVESLEHLVKKHPLERIRNGADELRLAIQTRGFVFNKDSTASSEASRSSSKSSKGQAFQSAWDQLSDPLLPVQGHAILTLSHLLKNKDEQALKNRERLLKVFLDSLEHEDSYIYLMGIQALGSLADVFTEQVVQALVNQLEQFIDTEEPKLVTDYDASKIDTPRTQPVRRPAEVRLKVGEALLQVVRLVGPLIPKYKRVLLNSFLRGTKDEDAFVRASCLHNLGELCALLRYSLDSVAFEVLNCVTNLVARDPAVEVRRAAVLLITLLLRGLDSEALQVLEPIIKDLYRVLKEIVLRDNDDRVVLFHANQGLEKLADIVKQYLTAPKLAGKTIRELRLP